MVSNQIKTRDIPHVLHLELACRTYYYSKASTGHVRPDMTNPIYLHWRHDISYTMTIHYYGIAISK